MELQSATITGTKYLKNLFPKVSSWPPYLTVALSPGPFPAFQCYTLVQVGNIKLIVLSHHIEGISIDNNNNYASDIRIIDFFLPTIIL